jgi:hypothetical protein
MSGNAWDGDAAQLMFADSTRTQQIALTDYALGGYEDQSGKFVADPNQPDPTNPTIVMQEAGTVTDSNCNCPSTAVVKRDSVNKKTYYEIQVPAAALGLTAPLKAGAQIGLGVCVNDGDGYVDPDTGTIYGEGASQQGQKGWGGLGPHSIVFGKTPSETALLTLVTNQPTADRLFFASISLQPDSFSFRVNDKGASVLDPKSVTASIDGQAVTMTASPKVVDATDFSYKATTLFTSGKHTYILTAKDTSGNTVTNTDNVVLKYALAKDTIAGIPGFVFGPGGFTADKGGHSGQAGDYAVDSTTNGATWVQINSVGFLNAAASNDVLSVALWIKKYDIATGSAFWGQMSSADDGTDLGGLNATVPAADDTVRWDTNGCCDPNRQEISADINTFPPYSAVGTDDYWTNWHHFVFTKNKANKNIYIDGQLFLNGSNTDALRPVFTYMDLFYYPGGANAYMHGIIDDFAMFSTEVSAADAAKLASGTEPPALSGEKLIAYWPFNDPAAPAAPTLSVARTASGLTITFTGTLQSAQAVTGPWTDMPGASPATVTPTGKFTFYRSKE